MYFRWFLPKSSINWLSLMRSGHGVERNLNKAHTTKLLLSHKLVVYWGPAWASSRSTLTTDSKANQSGISSPARSILRNLVPDRDLRVRPFSLA